MAEQQNSITKASQDEFLESKQQPLWHVIVLSIFTLFAYSLVWFFKNWNELSKAAAGENHSVNDPVLVFRKSKPILETFALLIPVLQIYITCRFFCDAATLRPDTNSFAHRKPIVTGIFLTIVMLGLLSLSQIIQGPFYLLYLLAAIPLAVVQNWINKYWQTVEPSNALVRQAFTPGEMVALILGSIFLGLTIVHFYT
jgi:hypothetical protein